MAKRKKETGVVGGSKKRKEEKKVSTVFNFRMISTLTPTAGIDFDPFTCSIILLHTPTNRDNRVHPHLPSG